MTLPVDLSMARACALARRLTPGWQDEAVLLDGLRHPNMQIFVVLEYGLAERRRIGGLVSPVRWQMRLAGGTPALARAVMG